MRYRIALGIVAVALVASACDDAPAPTTTAGPTTTTFAPIEIVAVSTTIAPGVDPTVHEQLIQRLDELVASTEELRGLAYLQVPDIAVVADRDFKRRYAATVAPILEDERVALEEATFRLLGQHNAPARLSRSLTQLYGADGAVAFYDGATSQVVVDGTRAELSPLQASIVVRALAWALIDQYHDAFDRIVELEETGNLDQTDALRTLAEADAIATQLRYLQGLSEDDQANAAAEAAEFKRPGLSQVPDVVRDQLAMPAEEGVLFVDELVGNGGYAALDRAYDPPPETMEQVLHPRRFAIRETVRDVPKLDVSIDGYETVATGTYGEWRLRQLLNGSVAPGLLTQTVAGWGGDAYQLLQNGDELAFVYIYGGDTEDDAIEVAQAMLALARGPLAAGDGIDSGGGVLWEGPERYVFVDRIGDGLVLIIATSQNAGATARRQIRVP